MSETTEAPAAEPEVTTPAPEAPETPAAEPSPEPAASETPTEPAAGEEPWRKVRIEQLSREKNEARRERDLAQKERDELRTALAAAQAGQTTDTTGLTTAQIQAEARKLANAELAARDMDVKTAKFLEVGRKEFADFDDRCNTVASMGAAPSDRPEFMMIIGDMDDGARVVAHLADNPAEAARVLALPPHLMGLALAKIERTVQPKAATPKPTTQAPKPPTPVGGQTVSRGDINDPNISMKEWVKLREADIKARTEARR